MTILFLCGSNNSVNRCKLVLSEAERIRVEKRQNNEKNRWKRVENDEKLSLIWKNKPNLWKAEMNTKSIITRGYEKYNGLDTWWKQTQFKAKQSQYYLAPRFIWGLKTQFEKTKPIFEGTKWLIFYNDKGLWRFKGAGAAKKQSQFKAKQSQLPNFGDFVLPPCLDKVCRKQEISVGRQRHKIGQDTLKPQSWPINE